MCGKDLQAALLTLQHHRAEQGAHLWGWETWTTEVLKGAPQASTMLPPAATKMTVSLFTKGSLWLTKPFTLYRAQLVDTCRPAAPAVIITCTPTLQPVVMHKLNRQDHLCACHLATAAALAPGEFFKWQQQRQEPPSPAALR